MFYLLRIINKYYLEVGELNLFCKSLEECYDAIKLASVRFIDFEYTIYRDADANNKGFLISKGEFCK